MNMKPTWKLWVSFHSPRFLEWWLLNLIPCPSLNTAWKKSLSFPQSEELPSPKDTTETTERLDVSTQGDLSNKVSPLGNSWSPENKLHSHHPSWPKQICMIYHLDSQCHVLPGPWPSHPLHAPHPQAQWGWYPCTDIILSLPCPCVPYLHWATALRKTPLLRNPPLAPQMTISGTRCPIWAGGWIHRGGMAFCWPQFYLSSFSTIQPSSLPALTAVQYYRGLTAATFHPTPGCHPMAGENIPSFNKWSEEPLEGTWSVQHHWGPLALPLPCFWDWSLSWLFFPQMPLSILPNTVCWWG